VISYDIMKVKNALIKSAHYIREFTTTYLHSLTKFLNPTLSGIKCWYYLKSSFIGHDDNFTDKELEVDGP